MGKKGDDHNATGSIIRTEKNKDRGFSVLENHAPNDDSLSAESLGVLWYLLSKPDNWVCRNHDIERRFGWGEYKLSRVFTELKNAGYLSRRQERNKDGRFQWVTVIYEIPRLNPDQKKDSQAQQPTIPESSRHGSPMPGSTMPGSAIPGRPRDILNTDPPSTELLSNESLNNELEREEPATSQNGMVLEELSPPIEDRPTSPKRTKKPQAVTAASELPDAYREWLKSNDIPLPETPEESDWLLHQATLTWLKVTNRWPGYKALPHVIQSLGDAPNKDVLQRTWDLWNASHYNPTNIEGILDRYAQGLSKNGHGSNGANGSGAAWESVLQAIQQNGRHTPLREWTGVDDQLRAVIGKVGVVRLCDMDQYNENRLRSEFKRAYEECNLA